MEYKELKKFCDEEIKKNKKYEKRYRKEIIIAKRFYDNGINLYEKLLSKKDSLSKRYVIPFLLGLTDKVIDLQPEYIQVKPGVSGGIDIDSDFSPNAKEAVQEYLINKYGEDRVLHVGTFTRLGVASAAKDLLRIYKVDFQQSNYFTKILESDKDWKWNLENMKLSYPEQYAFYEEHKEILDMVPDFVNKIRQGGKHAGGIVILDRPAYELIPVNRVSGQITTAFPESAQEQVLDEIGVIKFDLLGISILDVIADTIEKINEKIYLIEEDSILKIVSESYLDSKIKQF